MVSLDMLYYLDGTYILLVFGLIHTCFTCYLVSHLISPLKSQQYTGNLVHTFKHGLSQNEIQIWAV